MTQYFIQYICISVETQLQVHREFKHLSILWVFPFVTFNQYLFSAPSETGPVSTEELERHGEWGMTLSSESSHPKLTWLCTCVRATEGPEMLQGKLHEPPRESTNWQKHGIHPKCRLPNFWVESNYLRGAFSPAHEIHTRTSFHKALKEQRILGLAKGFALHCLIPQEREESVRFSCVSMTQGWPLWSAQQGMKKERTSRNQYCSATIYPSGETNPKCTFLSLLQSLVNITH